MANVDVRLDRAADDRLGRQGFRQGRRRMRSAKRRSAPRTSACRALTGGYEVDHVSLSVRKGEILGIYGLMGAGRSEFFDCVMGRRPHATGRIFIDGEPVAERDVTGRIRRGLALDPGRPAARGARVDPLGRRQSDPGEPVTSSLAGFHIGGAREQSGDRTRHPRSLDQGRRPRAWRSPRCRAATSRRW